MMDQNYIANQDGDEESECRSDVSLSSDWVQAQQKNGVTLVVRESVVDRFHKQLPSGKGRKPHEADNPRGIQSVQDTDILKELDNGFRESKTELIQRFLFDQAELNKRFEELGGVGNNDHIDHAKKGCRKSRKASRMNLQNELILRSRTAVGFHKDDPKDIPTTSDSSSESLDTHEDAHMVIKFNNRANIREVSKNDNPVHRRLSVPLVRLQPSRRPKTSIARRKMQNGVTAIEDRQSAMLHKSVPYGEMPHDESENTLRFDRNIDKLGYRYLGDIVPTQPNKSLSQIHNSRLTPHIESEVFSGVISSKKGLSVEPEMRSLQTHREMSKMECFSPWTNCSDLNSSSLISKPRHQRRKIQQFGGGRSRLDLSVPSMQRSRSSMVKLPPLETSVSNNFVCY